MKIYNENEIKEKLKELYGWVYEGGQLVRNTQFKDFKEAMKAVNSTAEKAEMMDHHPDIYIHSWNKVKFTLSTHSEGGITQKDFELAEKINTLLNNL